MEGGVEECALGAAIGALAGGVAVWADPSEVSLIFFCRVGEGER